MPRVGLLVAAFLALGISAVCAYLARPTRGLEAVPPAQDLGPLAQGVTVPVTFELVNRSGHRVEIVQVISRCSCAVAALEKEELAPGERTKVEATLKTGARRGAFRSELVVVYVMGDEQKTLGLQLQAIVEPDYEVEPEGVLFEPGQKQKLTIQFSPGRQKAVVLKQAISNHRAIGVRLTGEACVEISFDPDQWPPEGAPLEVRVETTSANEPWYYLPVAVKSGEGETVQK